MLLRESLNNHEFIPLHSKLSVSGTNYSHYSENCCIWGCDNFLDLPVQFLNVFSFWLLTSFIKIVFRFSAALELRPHPPQSYFIRVSLWSNFELSVGLARAIIQKTVLVNLIKHRLENTFRYGIGTGRSKKFVAHYRAGVHLFVYLFLSASNYGIALLKITCFLPPFVNFMF